MDSEDLLGSFLVLLLITVICFDFINIMVWDSEIEIQEVIFCCG